MFDRSGPKLNSPLVFVNVVLLGLQNLVENQIPPLDMTRIKTRGLQSCAHFMHFIYISIVPVTEPVVAQSLGTAIALLFHDHSTRRCEWSAALLDRTLLPENFRYPLYRRLGWPQGRSGRAKNLAPTGFQPRPVQPAVSRYTD